MRTKPFSNLVVTDGTTTVHNPTKLIFTSVTSDGKSLTVSGGGSLDIGSALDSGTAGSVLFLDADKGVAENNTSFYWDDTNTQLKLTAGGATKVPLLIKAAGSQTGNLFQVTDSSDAILCGANGGGLVFQNYAGSRIWNSDPGNGWGLWMLQGYALSWGSGGAATAGFRRFADNVMASSPGTTYQTSHLMGGGTALASQAALDAPTGNVFHVTGTTGITSITSTNFQSGVVITLIFDGVLTVTDGSNLKLAGNFTTSADDTLTLVYDGTNWYEIARSAN